MTWRQILRSRSVRGLVAVVVAALALSGCSVYDAPLPGGPSAGDNPIHVVAKFRDVLDLVPQSTVKVNDVSVGKVKSIKLDGYVAEVTLELPRDTKLPDNATAQIRQTSLLGEKFVSLAAPQDPSSNHLSDGDVIGLDRTGRNPEVEEVFSALALLLNGGGVGQLQTIAHELNNAMGGREDQIRSVLEQIKEFMGQLDANKASVVAAIDNTARLATQLQKQDGTIKKALDDIPGALKSVNGQRADLVKLLKALTRLSDVGVRVIRLSKESTINSLRDLAPVLTKFAEAGDAFPKALQVFLTYPFVDEAVGRDPQVARNLHMGDYTNLSVNLDINVADLPQLPGVGPVCDALKQIRKQVRENAAKVADALVTPMEEAGVPKPVTDELRDDIVAAEIDKFMDQAIKQCQAPSYQDMLKFGQDQLDTIINDLPRRLQRLLNATPGIGGLLDQLTGSRSGRASGGGGGNGGGGGGGLPLPRAQLNSSFTKPKQIDPFGLAALGLDPGIGTMLLQGVAEVR